MVALMIDNSVHYTKPGTVAAVCGSKSTTGITVSPKEKAVSCPRCKRILAGAVVLAHSRHVSLHPGHYSDE
jgi:hypothetical protein